MEPGLATHFLFYCIAIDDHDDPNFDPTARRLKTNYPYPKVRSAVGKTDDPTMPLSTFRVRAVGPSVSSGPSSYLAQATASVSEAQHGNFGACQARMSTAGLIAIRLRRVVVSEAASIRPPPRR